MKYDLQEKQYRGIGFKVADEKQFLKVSSFLDSFSDSEMRDVSIEDCLYLGSVPGNIVVHKVLSSEHGKLSSSSLRQSISSSGESEPANFTIEHEGVCDYYQFVIKYYL